jgi:Tfp pilus assembly protein FimT
LIEVLIVLAIITILAAMGLVVGANSYRSYAFRSQRETVVSVLERTRSRAMANLYASPWVACAGASAYEIKRGDTCATGVTQDTVQVSPGLTISGFPATGIAFSQLAGTTTAQTIQITDGTHTATITTYGTGSISW